MVKVMRNVAPDGGWGWVATFGVALINLATRSIETSFGLLFGDILRDLNVGTTGASVVMSALDVTMNFSGLFVGPLLKRFSYRKVAIAGSILCAVGLAATSPAVNMAHIITTYSFINGIGVGLATSSAFVALNHYFKNKRGQAVGLSMAGAGIGMLVMPQLVRFLLDEYSFRGATLLLSGVAFNALVGAMLLQPVKWHYKKIEDNVEMFDVTDMSTIKEDHEDELPEIKTLLYDNKMRKNFSEVAFTTNGNRPPRRLTFTKLSSNMDLLEKKRKESVISSLSRLDFSGSFLQFHVNAADDDKDVDEQNNDTVIRRVNTHVGMSTPHSFPRIPSYFAKNDRNGVIIEEVDGTTPKTKRSLTERFSNYMDFGLLKDPIYLNILFGLSSFYVAEMNYKMVIPFFLHNLGYTNADVAFCLSMTAISDLLARIIVPPICDYFKIPKRIVFLCSVACVAITRSIMAEQKGWLNLFIWLSICGFFRGTALCNFTLCVSEYCTLEMLPSAFGLHMVGKAIFVMALGPVIGYIRDVTHSYPICIHAQSFCIWLCVFAWSAEYLFKYLRSKRISKN